MQNEDRGRWIERLVLRALGEVEPRGADDAVGHPLSSAVPLYSALLLAVTLYLLGAVVLVRGGGFAAITLGVFEIAVARGVTVPPRARALPLIGFLFGLVTILVGLAVLY